jgi:hypothetical protein
MALCAGGADGAPTVVPAVAEGELVGVGVSVGLGGGVEFLVGGAVVGCVLDSGVECRPEHAVNVSATKEERVRAVRRLTGSVLYFMRT